MNAAAAAPKVEWRSSIGPCPICGSTLYRRLGRRGGEAHRANLGAATWVVRCRDCHGVYCHPTLEPIGNPYSQHSAEEYFAGQEALSQMEAGGQLIAKAETLLMRPGARKLLELGCGRGDYLAGAAKQGWSVFGVEMTPEFASVAARKGVQVEVSSVETSTLLQRENEFDVIYLAAILEHVYRPIECLKQVHRALVPGGVVLIDVPNECSLRTRLGNLYMRARGRDWAVNLAPTFPPFHVVGFCPVSLRRALSLAGLDEVELNVVKWRDMLPTRSGFWGGVERLGSAGVTGVAGMIGDGDGIACWARKPHLSVV